MMIGRRGRKVLFVLSLGGATCAFADGIVFPIAARGQAPACAIRVASPQEPSAVYAAEELRAF